MMNSTNFKNETEIAYNYFSEAVIEIDDIYSFESNIKDLLRFLHANDFSINDVLGFYGNSDLQDEFDILRLMNCFYISDKHKENNTIAQSKCGYLVLITDDEEAEENFLINYLSKRYKNFEFDTIELSSYIKNSIYIINNKYSEGVRNLIGNNYSDWKGRYLIVKDDCYLAIDNSTGDCWCEEFENYQIAVDWLKNKFDFI